MAGLLHDLGARVVVLVDAMPEAHEAEARVLVLCLGNVFGDAVDGADLGQHVERGLIGAAVRRAPEAGDAGRNAGKRVSAGRAGKPHRGSGRVLLVVGVQDEDAVERLGENRVDHIRLARDREAHLQEVRGEIEIVARIDEGLADRIFVGHGRDRRHLGDHAVARDRALARIVYVGGVVIEGRERADDGNHDGHRVGVTPEPSEEARHLLVQHRVPRDGVAIGIHLLLRGQVAVEQQVASLEEVRLLGELVDRVAAIEQHALVAVDVSDARDAVRRRGEARVVGEAAGVAIELADVDDVGAEGAVAHRHRRLFAFELELGLQPLVSLDRPVLNVHGASPCDTGLRSMSAGTPRLPGARSK